MEAIAVDDDASHFVTEMTKAGARFKTHDSPVGLSWTYDVDDDCRQQCRKILAGVDRNRIGFRDAVVALIRHDHK